MIPVKRILVATDFGPAAARALRYAAEMATALATPLEVVHVVDDLTSLVATLPTPGVDLSRMQLEMEADALERVRDLMRRECPGVDATPVVLTSHTPAPAIVAYARDAGVDLIVAGTHGRSGISNLLLGSVAQKIVRIATCPVLTMHAEKEAVPQELPLRELMVTK